MDAQRLRHFTFGIAAFMLLVSALAYLGLIPTGWFRSPFDKVMHGLLFGLLALSLHAWLPPRRRILAWAIPLALGALDEGAQSLSRSRSSDVRDFAADAAGIVLAGRLARIKRPGSPTPSA